MGRRRKVESYELLHRRMIHETEVTLLYGLRFPKRVPRIPTAEVGKGVFDPVFAARYWAERVGDESKKRVMMQRV